jgi:glutathione synthase/RimK-type ligase-like ATP-grasp enzyme
MAAPSQTIILHANPREFDSSLCAYLHSVGYPSKLIDIRETVELTLIPRDALVINRIYPSDVFEHGAPIIDRAFKLITECEACGIRVLNSSIAARCDYSKFESAQRMQASGIRTPQTLRLDDTVSARLPFMPTVIKLDIGGFGRDAVLVSTQEQWNAFLNDSDWKSRGRIVQPLVRPKQPRDFRITVMFGVVVSMYERSLVDGWLGSIERGSNRRAVRPFEPALESIAIAASIAIDAKINAVDAMIDGEGPIIIENNPTPAFRHGIDEALGIDPTTELGDRIIRWLEGLG